MPKEQTEQQRLAKKNSLLKDIAFNLLIFNAYICGLNKSFL